MIHEKYQPLTAKKLEELAPEIQKWKDEGKDLRVITVDLGEDGEFEGIFKVPSEADVKIASRDGLKEVESNKELCRMTVLYPDPIIFSDILTKFWGISTPISKELVSACHITKQARVKKL
ncbi:MAG TPA: hypothetical protein PKK43_04690 [Spirochaetota bacterium]|nr:hypothetical protein [Spirochaetota bacterium]